MPILPLLLLVALPTIAADAPDRTCRMPQGWGEVAGLKPHFVVFGEQHGTREAPAFVADVVCALAARRERVLLAIEHEVSDDDALQRAWALPDERFATAVLQTAWTPTDDGRDSHAMFEMLVRLHRLKTRGAAIAVTAFNGIRNDTQRQRWDALPGQGPHEAAQAENIRFAAGRGGYDRVVVLVGNFHASRSTINDGHGKFESMTTHLVKAAPTVSLNMRSAGGSSWNCATKPGVHLAIGAPIADDAVECADHSYLGDPDLRRAPFMRIGAFPGETATSAYDGFFWVGRTSGSSPISKK